MRWNTLSPTTTTISPRPISPDTDTYIEKDSAINDEIEKLRHSATSCSVRSGGMSSSWRVCPASTRWVTPIDYRNMVISLRKGMTMGRDYLTKKLVELQYERNDINFIRNKFRVRGDVVEIFPAYQSGQRRSGWSFSATRWTALRRSTRSPATVKSFVSHVAIYPASHYIVPADKMHDAIEDIRAGDG